MLSCVSSEGVAAVVFPVAETAVPVKVFTSPGGSMSSKAIRSTTSTTKRDDDAFRDIAVALW